MMITLNSQCPDLDTLRLRVLDALKIANRRGAGSALARIYVELSDAMSLDEGDLAARAEAAIDAILNPPEKKPAKIISLADAPEMKAQKLPPRPKFDHQKLQDMADRIDLRDFVSDAWGVSLKGRGEWQRCRAVWRGGDNKSSFSVNRTNFHDHVDGARGDIYDFIQLAYGVDFADAIEMVLRRLGEDGKVESIAVTRETPNYNLPPDSAWQIMAHDEIKRGIAYLWSGIDPAPRYLQMLRDVYGLSDEQIRADEYGLNPGWRKTDYRFERDDKKVVHASLPPGILIPRRADGQIYGIRVRTLTGKVAKFLNRPDSTFEFGDRKGEPLDKYMSLTRSRPMLAIFGEDSIRSGQDILLVEGEFDRSCAAQYLPDVAVLTMGGNTTPIPMRVVEKLQAARSIWLCMDNDKAGKEGAARYVKQLGEQCVVLSLPSGKDICEFVTSGGDLRSWWDSRVGEIDF